MMRQRKTRWFLIPLGLLVGLGVMVYTASAVYRPDRPVATIEPGTSSEPAFVVQIIRPRVGLPLGGLLPPQLFGLEAHLGFASGTPGAAVGMVGPRHVELSAENWNVVLTADADGRATGDTEATFELMFEDQLQQIRCFPADSVIGTFTTSTPGGLSVLSGSFDVELARCEYASSGERLGWPAAPLILHGSFDGLPTNSGKPDGDSSR